MIAKISVLFRQNVVNLPTVGVRSIVISVSVCLLVFACLSYISKTPRPNFTKCSVHIICSRGSILLLRYVLSVLSMTSCFHAIGRMFRRVRQVPAHSDVRRCCDVVWSRFQVAARAKSAISDYIHLVKACSRCNVGPGDFTKVWNQQ